jgi:predicted acylesterase/phospholipase RssA
MGSVCYSTTIHSFLSPADPTEVVFPSRARCTSAAPMYFEPTEYDGNVCRDGGLLENNPVQIAVNEARTIWGPDIVFDTVLSLGCGEAKDP